MKLLGRQPAGCERCNQRAGAGHGLDSKAGGQRGFDHAPARVADARAAGVSHQRDRFTAPQSFDDFLAPFCFVELEITQQRPGETEML